ncbi:DUF4267 domain-containing protein [Paraconexibacter antarcticus]|uniref:DUF4267 domain-containing protein n=1 Tax=Paraconexibacter antarcticus TaxID=2949664 RepID=A0ABY5DRR5_9ACTN|nr:DUF4267 domain-containing protein [Paraconexibacter antarcticus]UTI63772.1 DUF4267 domain-containing protein [Paraconexibacter antarcticus]
MSRVDADARVTRYIQFVGVVRIAYGVIALFRPRLWPRFFRLDADDPDARAWNAFLGSRDIAIGVHALLARDPVRQNDAIWLNQGCEVFDTMVVGQEIRHGRPFGMFTAAGIVFNAGMHAIWLRVRLLRR